MVVLNLNGVEYGLTTERRTQLEKAHFGTTGYSLARYYEEASDGRVTFVPLPGRPLGARRVRGHRTRTMRLQRWR